MGGRWVTLGPRRGPVTGPINPAEALERAVLQVQTARESLDRSRPHEVAQPLREAFANAADALLLARGLGAISGGDAGTARAALEVVLGPTARSAAAEVHAFLCWGDEGIRVDERYHADAARALRSCEMLIRLVEQAIGA